MSLREFIRSARTAHNRARYPGDLVADMQMHLAREGASDGARSFRIDDARDARSKGYWLSLAGSMIGSAIAACLVTAFYFHQTTTTNPTAPRTTVAVEKTAAGNERPVLAAATGKAIIANDATMSNSSDPTTDANESASLIPSYEPMVVPGWSIVPSAETLDSVAVSPTSSSTSSEKTSS